MTDIWAYLGVSLLVIVTPGQDTALVIRNTLSGGRRAGTATAFGVAVGQATWTLAASAGVTALLVASEPVFLTIRLAGAAYLVFLGGQALLNAARGPTSAGPMRDGETPSFTLTPAAGLRQGVVSNLGNPKVAVFFTSLLPQFSGGADSSFATLLGLGLVFCSMTLVWLTVYAAVVSRAGDVLRRSVVRRALDGVMGVVLVGLGIRLATESR